jgi:osmotically-inducible protein OsmY
MATRHLLMAPSVALLLSLAGVAGIFIPAHVEPAPAVTTAQRARRTLAGGLRTADQRTADRVLARRVRRAIRSDPFLAQAAPAVKVTSRRGVVRLLGRVRTEKERSSIAFKAGQIAGIDNRVGIGDGVEEAVQ